MAKVSLEGKIREISEFGSVYIHFAKNGDRYVAQFVLGDDRVPQDMTLKVTAMGCGSSEEAIDLIRSCIWFPIENRIPEGYVILESKVFDALRKMFPRETMDINIYGPPWRFDIEYRLKDPGRFQDLPVVTFDYRFDTKSNDFGEIARSIFSLFKIPAEGVLLGPVGTSHISIGT
jgi:hypothetical protein